MRKLAIIGGKLQGLEAVYLAKKAGMETFLVDRKEGVPASALCDHFWKADVCREDPFLIQRLREVDLVLPALENQEALDALVRLADRHGFILAFDPHAYRISSSKIRSDQLFAEHQIPAPKVYPDCEPPYLIKPSGLSGSAGVRRIPSFSELDSFLKAKPPGEEWVVQSFVEGPSYSIEVIGEPGRYQTYEVTQIHMDAVYDCKRVTAPCSLPVERRREFEDLAHRLAEILNLRGIMDVEVIDDGKQFRVLEIDARIPSQTPTVVYHSSGINLLEEMVNLFCGGHQEYAGTKKQVSYEHLLIEDGLIQTGGEHLMTEGGPLALRTDFCGANEALTDYQPGATTFRGTFILMADRQEELEAKRVTMLTKIRQMMGQDLLYRDLKPPTPLHTT